MHQSEKEERLLVAKDAAKFLDVSMRTLYRYVEQKLLATHRASTGKRNSPHRFKESDLRAVFTRR